MSAVVAVKTRRKSLKRKRKILDGMGGTPAKAAERKQRKSKQPSWHLYSNSACFPNESMALYGQAISYQY